MKIPFNHALTATMGGTLVVALVLAGVTLDRRLVAELEEDARKDLSMTPPILVDRQETQGAMLRMHALEIAGSPAVGSALATGEASLAVRAAAEMAETWSEQAILIDSSGTVLAGPRAAATLSSVETQTEGPYAVVYEEGMLHGVALADVVFEGRRLGTAGVASALDAATSQVLAGLTLSEIILVGPEGRVTATTLDSAVAAAIAADRSPPGEDGVSEMIVGETGRLWRAEAPLGAAGTAFFVRAADRELAALPGLRGAALLAAGIALVVTILVALIVARNFARPVRALAIASRDLASGDFRAPLPHSRLAEISTVSRAFGDMRATLEKQLRQLAEANRELEEGQARLQALQTELVQRDRLVAAGRLVTELAHEIRNPVANVRNSLEVVKRHVDDPKAHQFTDLAIGELLRMHELAERMLDLNRPSETAGRADVRTVIGDVAALIELGDREGQWTVAHDDVAEATVAMGPDPLKQVLINLLTNAREAMPDGGVIDVVAARSDDSERVSISVADRGPGFRGDVRDRAFGPVRDDEGCRARGRPRPLHRGGPGARGPGADLDRRSRPGPRRDRRGRAAPGAGRVSVDAPTLLVVDDDEVFRLATAELLREEGYRVETAASAAEASPVIEGPGIDLLLLDLRMPGIGGLQVIEVLRRRGSGVPILMISGYGSVQTAVEAMHLGADDFLTKPVDPPELFRRVADLLDRRVRRDRVTDSTNHGIVGASPAMAEMLGAIRQVAGTEATVLIHGETGTGKELAARAVHRLSERSEGPFVPVNCAGLAEGLLESELFGHVRGAFTGAVRDRSGLFSAADGGTLFLDEVGDMSRHLQKRLLRVLQEREAAPVGSTRPRPVDVRIVAATHRDLRAEMEGGRFREDLYYRLAVFPIHVPPLRDRAGDIPLLARHLLERIADRSASGRVQSLSGAAMRALREHPWPGNIRELFAALESAAIRAGASDIGVQHLPPEVRNARTASARYRAPEPDDERAEIIAALDAARGVRADAARALGMSRTTLWRRMSALGLLGEADEAAPEE